MRINLIMPVIILTLALSHIARADCYTLNDSAQAFPKIIENVYNELNLSGILETGFPKYSITEIIGDFDKPHTIKAEPDSEAVDAILTSEGKFLTFGLWGLNQIFPDSSNSDSIFLLKEKDEEAISNGFKGFRRNKFIVINYIHLFPRTESGIIKVNLESNKIIKLVRNALLTLRANLVRCH